MGRKSYKMSEETKRKISKSNKGDKCYWYGKKIDRNLYPKKGHFSKHSDKTKRKMSISAKNKPPVSAETARKISEKRKGYKWSKIVKQKMSLAQKGKPKLLNRGEKSHFWKGGITPINQKIRHSIEYKLWREAVFKRDNCTCVWCGARKGNGKTIVLNADHIQEFYLYPELRFAIDNGRTLCKSCHHKRHRDNKVRVKSDSIRRNLLSNF